MQPFPLQFCGDGVGLGRPWSEPDEPLPSHFGFGLRFVSPVLLLLEFSGRRATFPLLFLLSLSFDGRAEATKPAPINATPTTQASKNMRSREAGFLLCILYAPFRVVAKSSDGRLPVGNTQSSPASALLIAAFSFTVLALIGVAWLVAAAACT